MVARVFADADAKAREYVKSYGLKAKDVMTRFIVTVPSRASLADVAEILDTDRIRQVPVMDDGKLVGMISRTDPARKLAEIKVTGPATRPDNGALQKAIWDQVKAQPWLKAAYVSLAVKDGVVELWGAVDSQAAPRAEGAGRGRERRAEGRGSTEAVPEDGGELETAGAEASAEHSNPLP